MTLSERSFLLLEECGKCRDRFFTMREREAVPDFFQEVKPYADTWHSFIKEWQAASTAFILEERPKYIHKIQIDNAVDGMNQFFVQSFYKETGKKRFIQTIQAAEYTIQTLIRAIEEAGETK